jgi:hypothetical protein
VTATMGHQGRSRLVLRHDRSTPISGLHRCIVAARRMGGLCLTHAPQQASGSVARVIQPIVLRVPPDPLAT